MHPSGLDLAVLRQLRDSGAEIVSVEVYTHAEEVVPRSVLQYGLCALLSLNFWFNQKDVKEKDCNLFFSPGPWFQRATYSLRMREKLLL